VIGNHVGATMERKSVSSTKSELITWTEMSGKTIKREFFSIPLKTKTILLISKERSTSMNNSLQTKSKFTSQALSKPVRISAEDLMS